MITVALVSENNLRKMHITLNSFLFIDFDKTLFAGLMVEKLEWGNSEQICHILENHAKGFDLILGADIYIHELSFPHSSCYFYATWK